MLWSVMGVGILKSQPFLCLSFPCCKAGTVQAAGVGGAADSGLHWVGARKHFSLTKKMTCRSDGGAVGFLGGWKGVCLV